MKKFLAPAFFLAAAMSFGVECSKNNIAYVSPSERGEPFLLKSSLIDYVVTYRYTNPTSTKAAQVLVGLPKPVFKAGFYSKSFTSITINKIDSRVLEPKKYEIFNTPEASGVDVHYNFDGIPMIQRFFVTVSSPLLTMTWRKGEGADLSKIKKMTVHFRVMPNAAGKDRDSYFREIVTPAGKYSSKPGQRREVWKLSPQDSALILQDSKYESGEGSEYESPVLLRPDWNGILSGLATFGTMQDMTLNFELDPLAKNWNFQFLVTEKKFSNVGFFVFLKDQNLFP